MGIYLSKDILELKNKDITINELDKLVSDIYNDCLRPVYTKDMGSRTYKTDEGLIFRILYRLINKGCSYGYDTVKIEGLEIK